MIAKMGEIERAKADAARVAEWLLDTHNDDWSQELALDFLNDYVGGIDVYIAYDPHPAGRRGLAWALTLTERRADLNPHEEKLLELAWEKVREDAIQDEWERMGL